MILSDSEILDALASNVIAISPEPHPDQFKPSALDLHFDGPVYRYKNLAELSEGQPAERPVVIDSRKILSHEIVQRYGLRVPDRRDRDGEQYFPFEPGDFVLASTLEKVTLPSNSMLAARVEGRSSFARLGLVVHMTAPTIHCGFSGTVVLEMYNFGSFEIKLYPQKTRICQLIFERVGAPPQGELRSEHQGQTGPA